MRRFVLQFLGGWWHGRSLDSQSPDPEERILAQTLYFLASDGKVGGKIAGLSAEAIQFAGKRNWEPPEGVPVDPAACDYMVIDRREEGPGTVVVLKHGARP